MKTTTLTHGLGTAVLSLLAMACGSDSPAVVTAVEPAQTVDLAVETSTDTSALVTDGSLFPDVLEVVATRDDLGTWSFAVTLSSPYDTPERYADGWRVLDENGNELGLRVLGHDHQSEQPFTRSLSGVEIPDGVSTLTIQGRDQISGWGGATIEVALQQ